MKINKKYLFFFLIPFLFLINYQTAFAVKGEALSVKPIYPANQEGGETGFFNLRVTPGEQLTVALELRNDSTEEVKVNLTALQASTSDAGVIAYNDDKTVDASTKHPFKDIVSLEKDKITIPASSSETIKIGLAIPTDSYSGKLVGGITVLEDRNLTADEKKQSVVNEFQYAIPIVLFENDDVVEPEIELITIEPGLRNFRPFIEATLRNSSFININKMTIDSTIINRKTNKTLITRKELNYQMAPTSSFNFGFDLQNSNVVAGEYLAEFNIVADGKSFNLKKAFSISKATAEEINSQNLYSDDSGRLPIWVIIVIAILAIFIIGIIIFFVIKRKNKKKVNKKRKKKKHSNLKRKGNKKSSKNKIQR